MTAETLDISMGASKASYLASVEGVLRGAGWWEDESYRLAGMTGGAFRFVVHEDFCPSSVTMYDWGGEHVAMMDRIGVQSEVFDYFNNPAANTFEKIRDLGISRIRKSIDRGVGVVIWAPAELLEFGIVRGYDDDDGVFFVSDPGAGEDADPLLYENLGRSQVPLLSYQLFYDRVDVDEEKTYRNSLEYAVAEWNKQFHVSPAYASGRKAYEGMLSCLGRTDPDDLELFGLSYIIMVYGWCREQAARYLEAVAAESHQLKIPRRTVCLYRRAADNFSGLSELLPFPYTGQTTLTGRDVARMTTLLGDSMKCEDEAMRLIGEALQL